MNATNDRGDDMTIEEILHKIENTLKERKNQSQTERGRDHRA